MAYDEALVDRIPRVLGPRPDISEKRMFGGRVSTWDGTMSTMFSPLGRL